MNVYITTTALSPDSPPPDNHRRDSHRWKLVLLDACSALIKQSQFLDLKGIVTPERISGGHESYGAVAVQSIPTTIEPGHEDYELASEIHHTIANAPQFSQCLREGEVLHITDKAKARNLDAFGDCEHQLLFERMQIEAPCLIIDGDLLIGRVQLEKLNFDRSMVINNSSLVYVHRASDQHHVLNSEPECRPEFEFIQSAHLCDGIMRRLYKLGFALSKQ